MASDPEPRKLEWEAKIAEARRLAEARRETRRQSGSRLQTARDAKAAPSPGRTGRKQGSDGWDFLFMLEELVYLLRVILPWGK